MRPAPKHTTRRHRGPAAGGTCQASNATRTETGLPAGGGLGFLARKSSSALAALCFPLSRAYESAVWLSAWACQQHRGQARNQGNLVNSAREHLSSHPARLLSIMNFPTWRRRKRVRGLRLALTRWTYRLTHCLGATQRIKPQSRERAP